MSPEPESSAPQPEPNTVFITRPLRTPCTNQYCVGGTVQRPGYWPKGCTACDGFGWMETVPREGERRYFQTIGNLALIRNGRNWAQSAQPFIDHDLAGAFIDAEPDPE